MGSIYRKGRDQYFYYQAYVYNPASKKKDKRVFHSLGTKNLEEAKKKKVELDKKYATIRSDRFFLSKLKNSKYFFGWKLSLIVIILIGCSLFLLEQNDEANIFTSKIASKNIRDSTHPKTLDLDEDIKIDQKLIDDTIFVELENEIKKTKNIVKALSYEVIKVEHLSQNFNQGKIYSVVNEDANDDQLYQLCNLLRSEYKEFSNIIICLYRNNKTGIDLASGKSNISQIKNNKKVWLAMYTYNPSEGEYFDSNPGRYYGLF